MDDVVTGDCLEKLADLPAATVDLAFADPPFNIGYEYDVLRRPPGQGRLPGVDGALAGRRPAGAEADRVVLRGHRRRVRRRDEGPPRRPGPDAAELDRLALHLRRQLHEEVQPQPRPHLLLRRSIRSTSPSTPTRCECRRPGRRPTPTAAPIPSGKLPDDTWVLRPQEDDRCFTAETDTWYVSRVCGTFKERTRPSLPDAGGGAGAHHPRREPTRANWCSTRSPAAARRWPPPNGWAGVIWASSCRRTMRSASASG